MVPALLVAEDTRDGNPETARLGDEIYERDGRQEVEARHHGAVIAIDVESGGWAIGDTAGPGEVFVLIT